MHKPDVKESELTVTWVLETHVHADRLFADNDTFAVGNIHINRGMPLMNVMKITSDYSVAPQISPEDIATLAVAGFVAVICNRPDDEDPGQPTAAEIAVDCEKAGIAFHHIPVIGMPLPPDAVREQRRIVEDSEGPVLGYCRSGQRSAVIFEASA